MGDLLGTIGGQIGVGGAGAIINSGLGMLGSGIQLNRQRQLMNLQMQNQQSLNEQGRRIQMQMWRDTNYPAQIKMLKEAGLNPALIYGKGGAGGTTGGQSGGSAASGNSGMPLMGQLGIDPMTVSNIAVNKAQADKLSAEAEAIRGYKKDESQSNVRVNDGKVELMLTQQDLNLASKELKEMESKTQASLDALNMSLTDLNAQKYRESEQNIKESKSRVSQNEQNIAESKTRAALNQLEIDWNLDTGMNRNDSVVGKTIQYLSRESGLDESTLIALIGSGTVLKQIMEYLPASVLKNLLEGKPTPIKGFGK